MCVSRIESGSTRDFHGHHSLLWYKSEWFMVTAPKIQVDSLPLWTPGVVEYRLHSEDWLFISLHLSLSASIEVMMVVCSGGFWPWVPWTLLSSHSIRSFILSFVQILTYSVLIIISTSLLYFDCSIHLLSTHHLPTLISDNKSDSLVSLYSQEEWSLCKKQVIPCRLF